MPPKRTRRTSPGASGLNAGEKFKRAKTATSKTFSTWGWVGTEASSASEITWNQRLATCGFSERSVKCTNRYATEPLAKEKENCKSETVSGELEDDVIVISDDETLSCSNKSCKTNPYCLNYIGQEKWEDEDKAREAFLKGANLGEDPSCHSREPDHPVGLKNLGATCYANAYLQVWFQDLPFRTGVFSCQLPNVERTKLEDSPIFQLQVTFSAMQESNQNMFNPIKLVESLKLRTTEQQDAQEFSKLFMAHLDTEFQKQPDPVLKTLIPDQFQGKQIYGTICERCHHRSERTADFLEVELTIKNNATLEDRIATMLEPETLSGDNKYFCPQCDSLQDAKRYTELRELPPVLHFSLLRFVYDLSSMERKKSKHNISFPTTIDMDRFLGSPESRKTSRRKSAASGGSLYELRGVLFHKGSSAYHGHYEAQVFDVRNQSWYQFNDEVVTCTDALTPKPRANGSGQDDAKAGPENKSKTNGRTQGQQKQIRKRRAEDSDSEIEILGQSPSSGSMYNQAPDVSQYISSKDAYMLVYSRMDARSFATAQNESSTSKQKSTTNGFQKPIPYTPTPPSPALDVVKTLNVSHMEACEAYETKQKQAIARFTKIRNMVMDVYRTWNVGAHDKGAVVVSRQALELWLSRHLAKPGSEITLASREPSNGMEGHKAPDMDQMRIMMNEILCDHGLLHPDRAGDMKLITKAARQRIACEDLCELLPVLTCGDVCEECVRNEFQERLYQIEHPRMVSRFDEVCFIENDEPGFWISKAWLKDWRLMKPKMHVASRRDPSPDGPEYVQHVKCEHGGLSANITARRRISLKAYDVLRELFPSWEAISTDAEPCPVCEALIHISKEDKRGIRRQAEEEKAKLKHMHDHALTGNTALLENVPCAIVPAQFVRSWRQWLVRPGDISRPTSVDNSQFMCEHGHLSFDPNELTDLNSSVAIIKLTDWNTVEELYSGGPLIAVENCGGKMVHDIPVCTDCRLKKKSDYEFTEITVRVLAAGDPLPNAESYAEAFSYPLPNSSSQATLLTYGSRSAGGLRQSKRIRQVKAQGKCHRIIISKTMAVKDIKTLIQEELEIPIISQRLFYRGKELDDSAATVTSLGILSNDVVDLREVEEIVDLLSDSEVHQERRKNAHEGQGFGGTLLGGLATSHDSKASVSPTTTSPATKSCCACTFENSVSATVCTICETPFRIQ